MLAAILTWIVFGFVVGLIARAVYPGQQALGFVETTILGILGSFIGGFLASLLGGYPILEFRTTGFLGSFVGALVVLGLAGVGRRSPVP